MPRSTTARGLTKALSVRRARKRAALYSHLAGQVEPRFRDLHDEELNRQARKQLRRFATRGQNFLDSPAAGGLELMGLLQEVAWRALGLRPHPVQLAAAMALHDGHLVQLATGEGKTLAAILPTAILASRHERCHVLTFNDYLARRDASWMKPFFDRLNISVAAIQASDPPPDRRLAYTAQVTYATAKQVGFDLLRDGLVFSPAERVLPPLGAVLVDEADSILIDEARIPLVIAGERRAPPLRPERSAELVRELQEEVDYIEDADGLNVNLTEAGLAKVESALGVTLHEEDFALLTSVNQALFARVMLQRDVEYLVQDDRILLVDELTGRVVPDRRWPDGLQSAVEAKEGIPVQPGGRVLGSITLLHLLESYSASAGMTATAMSAADEFEHGYGLPVVPFPPHTPCLRRDLPDAIYGSASAKEQALVRRVQYLHLKGRPVLVGTASVEESERIAALLASHSVPCHVLNAKNDAEEAAIVANAGSAGAVTVSTNMAGRGTDIRLGGAEEPGRPSDGRPTDGRDAEWVRALGGLCVLGTNRHESSRIDDQLRGRAGRQGDPGESQFLISLEDPIMVRNDLASLLPASVLEGLPEGAIDHPLVRREVERVQRIARSRNRETRATTAQYAILLDQQRHIVAERRRLLVEGEVPPVPPALRERFGPEAEEWTRRLHISAIDDLWADHLELAADVKEGVHLVRLGGLDPMSEFHKQVATAFSDFDEQILRRVDILSKEADLEAPPGPGATWTYLINDRVGGLLQNMLFGSGSSAFSAAAALMTWPLLLFWGWKQRRSQRNSR